MSIFNIPTRFIQGDRISWTTIVTNINPTTVSCFIRGLSNPLDLTAVNTGQDWAFTITEAQSAAFVPGRYKAQLVVYDPERKTLAEESIEVCQGFEKLTELETLTPDEIELEAVTKAIAQLSSKNVAEYYIGTRKVRYNDLASLYERQKYLRNRIAKSKNKSAIGGRNVGVRFRN